MQDRIRKVAATIEHTLLKPEATRRDIETVCDEAVNHGFAAVCVMPVYVNLAKGRLAGKAVKVVTPIGFPLGP